MWVVATKSLLAIQAQGDDGPTKLTTAVTGCSKASDLHNVGEVL
jgi:hypothetical protein